MSKIRIEKKERYTMIDNSIIQNKDLSLKAIGLFTFMWSLPDDWDFSISGLSKFLKDGKDSIRSAIQELENVGYLKRVPDRNKGKFSGQDYILNESIESPLSGFPTTVNPTTEKPTTVNPTQTNKIITNKTITNKERERIDYQQIADMYNNTCVSFPRLTSLSDARKKSIKARMNTYSIDDFQRVFDKAECSSFMKGKNDRNWSATFDWMMKDSNIAKILDGNYDDKENKLKAVGQTEKQELPAWLKKTY